MNNLEYKKYLKGLYYGILKEYEKNGDYKTLIEKTKIELFGIQKTIEKVEIYKLISYTSELPFLKYQYFRNLIINNCVPLIDSLFEKED